MRARRQEYFEAPPGVAPPRQGTTAVPATRGSLDSALDALGGLDQPQDTPVPAADLQALDQELAHRRSQAPPR